MRGHFSAMLRENIVQPIIDMIKIKIPRIIHGNYIGQGTPMVKKWTVSWLFVATLVACSPEPATTDEVSFCQQGVDPGPECQVSHGESPFNLTLFSSDPSMPTETPLTLELHANVAGATIEGAEVRGRSMYMGRIPVQVEQRDSSSWQAELLLGACTDPDMVWQLELRLRTHEGQELEFIIPFQSSLKS